MTANAAVRAGGSDVLERIISLARASFTQMGVSATRIEDISRAAGMTRQNLYRYVSGRDELVELVMVQRVGEIGAELSSRASVLRGGFRNDIVELLVAAIEAGRHDAEFGALAEALPRFKLNVLLASSASAMHNHVGDTFRPLLRQGLAEGLLRTDVSEDEMVEWLAEMLTLYVPRVDLDGDPLRRKVERFVLRALTA